MNFGLRTDEGDSKLSEATLAQRGTPSPKTVFICNTHHLLDTTIAEFGKCFLLQNAKIKQIYELT